MTTDRSRPDAETAHGHGIAVTIVDTDVHPMPVSTDVLKSYAPADWVDKIWPTGNAVAPVPHFYDTPTRTRRCRCASMPTPPGGFRRQRSRIRRPATVGRRRGEHRGARADVRRAAAAARARAQVDVQRLAGRRLAGSEQRARAVARGRSASARRHPSRRRARSNAGPAIRTWPGTDDAADPRNPFGNPHFDPLYEAASRNGLPVATHLMGQTPFELIPLYPVGNPAHWHDFFASWPLLYVSHLMSLVFDGAFDRHPDLRVVFVEGGFTWAMPVMSRMDRIWEPPRRPAARASPPVGVRPRTRPVHHPAAGRGRRRPSASIWR